jgi:hypothetical protein
VKVMSAYGYKAIGIGFWLHTFIRFNICHMEERHFR